MEYSENASLPSLWFDIYRVVLEENDRLNGSAMNAEALSTITTSIFISVTQRNKFGKPSIFNRFQNEILKLVSKVRDRGMQESIYKSVKVMIKERP